MNLQFPKGFYWGASTASHQVEGGHTNDWTAWETSPEREAFLHAKGEIEKYGLENFISGAATKHREFYREDFALAKELGHNATRFSIEWSRIEPKEGEFNQEEIWHYKEVVRELRKLGIEPFVTLWHWPIPLWLRDKGGWENKDAVQHFARFVHRVVSEIGEDVTFWITLNEAEIYAANSYLAGVWPPQSKNPIRYLRVVHNLIDAHKAAYQVIHQLQPDAQVGVATNNAQFEASSKEPINMLITKITDWWSNHYFLRDIRNYQDFIGLNHYFHNRMSYGRVRNANKVTSDMGWELHPKAIYHVLKDLKRYNKPIYVTENGLADAADTRRGWFLTESLKNIHRAIQESVDVRGYLHWSLMDNFEWNSGFWPRFGLIEITKDMKRIPRKSSLLYRDICTANAITDEVINAHASMLTPR